MNRRNFIGNLIAGGAGFIILPSATTHARIWVPSRAIVVESVGSIWRDYYVSREFLMPRCPPKNPKSGQVVKHFGELWYGTSIKWLKLEKLYHPLTWPMTVIGLEPVEDKTTIVWPDISKVMIEMPEIV